MSPRLIPCFAPDVRAEPSWGWRAHALLVVVSTQSRWPCFKSVQHEPVFTKLQKIISSANFISNLFLNCLALILHSLAWTQIKVLTVQDPIGDMRLQGPQGDVETYGAKVRRCALFRTKPYKEDMKLSRGHTAVARLGALMVRGVSYVTP